MGETPQVSVWKSIYGSHEDIVKGNVGWLINITQDEGGIHAILVSHDNFRQNVGGVPAFSFLLALPKQKSKAAVLLLRVIGSDPLRTDVVKETLLQYYQNIPHVLDDLLGEKATISPDSQIGVSNGIDSNTQNYLSFGGYRCEVLGCLYENISPEGKSQGLTFAPDVDYIPTACFYSVIKPRSETLSEIMAIVKNSKTSSNEKIMVKMGFGKNKEGVKPSFDVGTLRFSATRNLSPPLLETPPPKVSFNFEEIVSQRTAVFGMTRTGKSNMIKHMMGAMHVGALENHSQISQIMFDINGEYANVNDQDDSSSMAEALGPDAVIYSMASRKKSSVQELRPDFYSDLQLGLTLIQKHMKSLPNGGGASESFVGFSQQLSFVNNHGDDDALEVLRAYLYRTLLYKAGYEYSEAKSLHRLDTKPFLKENCSGFDYLTPARQNTFKAPQSFKEALDWACRMRESPFFEALHPDTQNLLSLISLKGLTGNRIAGLSYIAGSINQHASNPSHNLRKIDEILNIVKQGKLLIIDLSHASPSEQIMLMEEIARGVFMTYSEAFVSQVDLPPCLLFIEEAHNLIGNHSSKDEVWPRIAKEGAKYKLGLVYATQEPSSILSNILCNTENFIVCHLNNQKEVKEIANFFDFKTFAESIIRIQEPGFVRIKQRDMPFVIPAQIDKFDVVGLKDKLNTLRPPVVPNQEEVYHNNLGNDVSGIPKLSPQEDFPKEELRVSSTPKTPSKPLRFARNQTLSSKD